MIFYLRLELTIQSVLNFNNLSQSFSLNTVFKSSIDAWSACKNVADAFAPAVQELLRQVVTHPQFAQLAN